MRLMRFLEHVGLVDCFDVVGHLVLYVTFPSQYQVVITLDVLSFYSLLVVSKLCYLKLLPEETSVVLVAHSGLMYRQVHVIQRF